jgi:hypothetical protein
MILPTGATVAVADGETVRLFYNTSVKPGGAFGRDHGGAACARPLRLGCAPLHRLRQLRWQAARRGRLRGSDGRVPEQAQPGRDHLVVVSDPRTLGDMRKHFHRDLRGKIIGELAKDFRHGRAKASDMVGHNVCYRGKYRYRYITINNKTHPERRDRAVLHHGQIGKA